MRKFKYSDGSEGVTYENLSELLDLEPIEIFELDEYYYIIPPANGDPYPNTIYKVNRTTEKAEWMMYTIFITMIDPDDKAKPIDPKTLKESRK